MKTKVLFFAIIFMLISVNGIWAYEITPASTLKMQETIYGATIDSKIAFYQKQTYLTDSEFTILSDIGNDAATKISYLKTNRQELIKKMVKTKVEMKQAALNGFLGKKL